MKAVTYNIFKTKNKFNFAQWKQKIVMAIFLQTEIQ